MALATWYALCLDAVDPDRLGPWWAAVLDRRWQRLESGPAAGEIVGPTPGHSILLMAVSEPKQVKHRVHLDIYARSLTELQERGSPVVEPQREGWRWTVMADPEGGEYCAFLRDPMPPDRLHGLAVDSVDPVAISAWWADVFGAQCTLERSGNDEWCTLRGIPGMPIETMDFSAVPEPKTVKNRIHWDLRAASVTPLLDAGARVLRAPDGEIRWHVLADPEGNEFCVFPESG